jgi:hypothetical protein
VTVAFNFISERSVEIIRKAAPVVGYVACHVSTLAQTAEVQTS